ncbi:imidazoleglycerol-phosphate dehydratase HisB [Myxococcota bacterium]
MEDRGPALAERTAHFDRRTRETQIRVEVNLDGTGQSAIETPLPFLSHMLEQVARHGGLDLMVRAQGDAEVDGHHTTEDLGFVLGKAVLGAVGSACGIRRYGAATLPMDEALVTAAIDLSARPLLVWRVPLPKAKIGSWDAELASVFFDGFARGCQTTTHLHLLAGDNLHHIVEATFKAFARALRQALEWDPRLRGIPSTKGVLT